jgi:hypothetical protein
VKRHVFFLLALPVTLALAPGQVAAALRSTQVPVAGSGLQDFFNRIGEAIDVGRDQRNTQRWRSGTSDGDYEDDEPRTTIQVELVRHGGPYTVGVYDANSAGSSELREYFAAAGSAECRAVSLFEASPGRLTVDLYDRHQVWRGRRSFGGMSGRYHGYYIAGPAGVGYSQDSRQTASGDVRMLVFNGTGRNSGGQWVCIENHDPGDADTDPDYDDTILFVSPVNATPTDRSTWARVKSLYR